MATACTMAGTSVGSDSPMPAARVDTICTAASTIAGRLCMMPERRDASICVPVLTNCGSMATAVSTSPVTASANAVSAPSTPFTMSVNEETTSAMAGRNSACRLFFTLEMVSPSPASVSSIRAWPSLEATSASLFR